MPRHPCNPVPDRPRLPARIGIEPLYPISLVRRIAPGFLRCLFANNVLTFPHLMQRRF